MNVATIVPLAAVGTTSGGATSTSAPSGFLDVLAAQVTAGADRSSEGDTGAATEEGTEGAAQDLLTLAALASRTASAGLPQLATVASPTEGATATEADGELTGVLDTLERPADAKVADVPVEAPTDAAAADLAQVVEVPAAGTADVAGLEGEPVSATSTVIDGEVAPAVDVATEASDAGDAVPAPTGDQPSSGTAPTGEAAASADDAPALAARPGERVAVDVDGPSDTPDATATLSRSDRAVPVTATDGGAGRARDTGARTTTDSSGASADSATGISGADAAATVAPTATGGPDRAASLTPSSAAQRVLDIVSQLEDAPPPRVVVIETGEIRVRLGLDGGTVRMTVLGPLGDAGEAILQEAGDALEAQGFGTELDRGSEDGDRGEARRSFDPDAPQPVAPRTRPSARSRAGLQL